MTCRTVWIFTGARATFPAGVFGSKSEATLWVRQHRLTGTLTEYPVGKGTYDWAIESGFFTPDKPEQRSVEFIQQFTSASQDHVHFEDGEI